MFFLISLAFADATESEITNEIGNQASAGVIKSGENEPDINAGVVGSDYVITDAVIDPSTKGNIETFVVKDNAPIAFYIINTGIDINNIQIENYYYRTINNRTVKVRCRDFKYNANTGIRIVPNKLYGKLKATDKINDCLFIYDVKYKLNGSEGAEDKVMRFAFKIVPEDEYVMYQNIEVKPVIEESGEIKRPKKVDS